MGTRGLIAFKYRGKYFIAYNHYDSYFSGLGRKLVNEIKELLGKYNLDEIRLLVDGIRVVRDIDVPTEEDIEKLKEYTDLQAGSQSSTDWYCLLRKGQGSYKAVFETGYMYVEDHLNEGSFIGDLNIEYSYVLDLDSERFVTYTRAGSISPYSLDNLPEL
eukprot:gene23573-30565_t